MRACAVLAGDVVSMFGVPGQPMLIPVSPEELEERRSRRAPRP
jgi:hypothetical protein